MNPVITSGAIVASMLLMNQNEEDNNSTPKKRKAAKNILLKGTCEPMDINANEKIIFVKVYKTYQSPQKWKADLNGDTIESKTAESCFTKIMEETKAKSINVIPYSVNKYDYVDGYMLMLKVEDEEQIEKEMQKQESLRKLEADMMRDIESENCWK